MKSGQYPDEELHARAQKIAQSKAAFYIHFGIYVVVNLLLVSIWWLTGDEGEMFPWFVFPLIGWGIGVAAHGIGTFRGIGYIESQTQKEYERLSGRR